jgi:phosphopantothenoylcysteine decarboxylase
MRSLGWSLCIALTPDAVPFLGLVPRRAPTTLPKRSEYRRPHENRLPPRDALLVAPMTCNTVNKSAAGIADTFALRLFAELIGGDAPATAVPWAKSVLIRHPAFGRGNDLRPAWGASVITAYTSKPLRPARRVPEVPWDSAFAALPAPAFKI